jgi:hypothetical protein
MIGRERTQLLARYIMIMLTWVRCQDTYNQARKKDATIKMEDVKSWYDRNLVRKNNLPGYNSHLYQIDLNKNIL